MKTLIIITNKLQMYIHIYVNTVHTYNINIGYDKRKYFKYFK